MNRWEGMYAETPRGCWLWTGRLYPNGYGCLNRREFGTTLAHRAFYMLHKGEVPKGLDLDHLCRRRDCVNPDHLEPVTRSVNLRRGAGSYSGTRETCRKKLHDTLLPGALRQNSDGVFECVECWRIRYRKGGQKYRDRLKRETGSTRKH